MQMNNSSHCDVFMESLHNLQTADFAPTLQYIVVELNYFWM